MKYTKNQKKSLMKYFIGLFFVIFMLFIIATGNNKMQIIVSNINKIKAVESNKIRRIDNYNYNVSINEYKMVSSIDEIRESYTKKIEFIGTMTGYGPDCVGCSGIVGCPPHQNVTNGNIYYNDLQYGKIRILAADRNIPCGSIIKLSNYKFIDNDFYGIVLDRGSDIKGLTMDLLHESENATKTIGRQYNIKFTIERWGF